jgi:hypothetical protein
VYYRHLQKLIKIDLEDDSKYVSIPEDIFQRLLAGAIQNKAVFDERFYLENYPDIVAAVRSRKIENGLDHYLKTGYFENRVPRKLIVDERYYLQENPDVADAIRKGRIKNAQEHFEHAGFNEGRSPYKGFSLF